jgi:hypothetical protein
MMECSGGVLILSNGRRVKLGDKLNGNWAPGPGGSDSMPPARSERRVADIPAEKGEERKFEQHYEVLSLIYQLKQNFPEAYRHVLGIMKAFLKER